MMRILALVALLFSVAVLGGCGDVLDARADRREAIWMEAHPPLGTLVEVEGRRIHVYVSGRARGTAPDVVLLHGSNGNLRDFTFDLVDRLAGDFRVIAVDRPGLGFSDSWGPADSDPAEQARVLRLAVAQLGVRRPIVLGHSYGGAVAMAWALQDQSHTAAVVQVSGATHPWGGDLTPWYRFNRTRLAPTVLRVIAAFAPESAAFDAVHDIFEPDPVPEGYAEYFGLGLSMRRESQADNARQMNALHGYLEQMQPHYGELHLPIEIVQGSEDPVIDPDIHARALVAEVPSARLTVVDGVGHMVHHTAPDAVVAAVRRAARRANGADR